MKRTAYPFAIVALQALNATPQDRRLSPVIPTRRPVLVHRESNPTQAGVGGRPEYLHDMPMLRVEKDPDRVVGRVELEQDPAKW